MILKTSRLTLRPQEQEDAAALFAILGDCDAMRFWNRPALPHLAVAQALIAEQQTAARSGFCRYWTVLEMDDPIGSVDLSLIKQAGAELGFLFRRDRWGLGLASEAVAAVVAAAFGPLRLTHLAAGVLAGNLAAIRVLEKTGFGQVRQAEARLAGGALAPCIFYTLTRKSGG
ncbi:MAG TPA: GNAT family N-acetyltransferase [Rhizomicrobium sp.]|nr:GNAT family N-acetyltransferase [Rhizomicrobium sp.]